MSKWAFYHAAHEDNVESIKTQGLLAERGVRPPGTVQFSTNSRSAGAIAKGMHGDAGRVVKFNLAPEHEVTNLRGDKDDMRGALRQTTKSVPPENITKVYKPK